MSRRWWWPFRSHPVPECDVCGHPFLLEGPPHDELRCELVGLKKRMQEVWRERPPTVLRGGETLQQVHLSDEDKRFLAEHRERLAVRKANAEDIARFFGAPPPAKESQ